MVSNGQEGALQKVAVASKQVTASNLRVMVAYAAGIKADSIGFVACKDAAGTTRKIMCQDV